MAKSGLFERWVNKHNLAIVLFLASAVIHFAWLGYPQEVIFDEVHFGKFITAYCCTHERFFDIHPPHAKLLIAGAAFLLGYHGGFSFENIGQPFGDVSILALRFFPAVIGTLLPLLTYLLLLRLRTSKPAAFFGGLLVLLDNASTVQTRIIALDGLLLATTLGSLIAYLTAESRIRSRIHLKFFSDRSSAPWWLFALAGGLAGLAVGTKFTGLVAIGLLVVLLAVWCCKIRFHREISYWLLAVSLVFISAFTVYASGWAIHFAVLQNPGSGDTWRVPDWSRPIVLSFYRETMELQKIMYRANSTLTATHHDSSYWWTWPLLQKPVYYWQLSSANTLNNRTASIYFIGNPLLWWGASAVFGASMLALLTQVISGLLGWHATGNIRDRLYQIFRQPFLHRAWLPIIGYFVAFIPLMRVTRALFLYHYLTPLYFSIIIGVIWLDSVEWFNNSGSVRQQPARYYIMLILVAIFFLMFIPLTYGLPLPPWLHQSLFWFKTWR